jgi:hypothetical protein
MGRYSTGAITTGEAIRIELSYLLKKGCIQKGKQLSGSISWTNDNSIGFESCYTEEEAYIRLKYQNTNRSTKEETTHDYKIQLTTIPSNLGKGEVLYFVCPVSGRNCRILYQCYGSTIWKSRSAYQNRIYYKTQSCSKYDYHNNRYWQLTKDLDILLHKRVKDHYKGELTRLNIRILKLRERQNHHDNMRWLIVPKAIQKMTSQMGLSSPEYLC